MPDLVFRLVVRDDGSAVVERFSSNVEKAQKRSRTAASQISKGFTRLTGVLRRLPSVVLNLRNALLGLAVGFVIRNVVNAFVQFERQMNVVGALTGAVGQRFKILEDQAKALGATTVFSARQAAEAQTFFARAGFEVEEIFKALPATLNLAAAAQLDLGTSSSIVIGVLKGLKIPVEDLAKANDVLVKAFTSSNLSLVALGESFKFVGPLAVGVGLEFEEVTSILAALADANITGSMAGTTLRATIASLISPSAQAAKVLRDLGVQATTSGGKIRPLTDILFELQEAGITGGQVFEVFGRRAATGVLALTANIPRLKELQKALADAGGTADRVAKRQLAGLSGALVRLRSATEGAKISIGEALAPTIVNAAKAFLDFALQITLAVKAITQVSVEMSGAADSGTGLGKTLQEITPPAEILVEIFFTLGRAARILAIGVLGLGASASLAGAFFGKLTDALGITEEASQGAFDRFQLLADEIDRQVEAIKENAAAQAVSVQRVRELRNEQAAAALRIKETNEALNKQKEALNKLGPRIAQSAEQIRIEALDSSEALKTLIPLNLRFIEQGILAPTAGAVAAFNQQRTLVETFGEETARRFIQIATTFQNFDVQTRETIFEQTELIRGNLQERLTFFQFIINRFIEEEKRRTAAQQQEAQRQQAIAQRNLRVRRNLVTAGISLLRTAGGQSFATSKAFALGEATVRGILAVQEALASPPGPPFTIPLAASIAALTAANVAAIAAARPGGGGGGVSVGGGVAPGGGAPVSPGAPAEAMAPPVPERAVSISVAGFVGDERTLASELGRVFREAEGDEVGFTLET